ncbi:Neurotransmitter-gated ion-channel [Trinorchestia longiramus]|nr:Neurotransmitter-gated ion-channel [Trinorchestia longiramus]
MAFWAARTIVAISVALCIRSTAEEYEDRSLALMIQRSNSQLGNLGGQSNAIFPIDDTLLGISEESSNIEPRNLQNFEHQGVHSRKENQDDNSDANSFDKGQNKDQILSFKAENQLGSIGEHSHTVRSINSPLHADADRGKGNKSQGLDIVQKDMNKMHPEKKARDNISIVQQQWRRPRILDKAQKDVLDAILKGYDVNEWPHFYYGKKTDVHVQMFINAFGSLNAESMDFRIDLFLRQMWQDPRLAYSDKREHLIVVDPETHKRIWRPDTYFDNVKVAQVHDVTVPNVMLRVTRMGDIMYTMRLALVLSCNMQLRLYPFDTQYCYVDLSSLSNTDDMLSYHWSDKLPIKITKNLEIAEFDLLGYTSAETNMPFATGNYSGLQAKFTLRRQNGYHLLQTYVPTILIVSMSWVSFWLDPHAVPGRVTLGVTTLLTLTTLSSGVRQSLPKVSYIKAVDVWLGMCMIMIFGVLIEFTAVNSLANKKKEPRFVTNGPGHAFVKLPPKTYITQARRIDGFSRILFPAVFLLFNIFYWTYYILRLYKEAPKIPFTY